MLKESINVFDYPNEALPYNTNIIATIRTENDDPIYSKLYPYPLGVSEFVNNKTTDMLRDNIIKPFKIQ